MFQASGAHPDSPAADIARRWANQYDLTTPDLDTDIGPRLQQLLGEQPDEIHGAEGRHALRLLAAGVQAMRDAGLNDDSHLIGITEYLLGYHPADPGGPGRVALDD
jgi:hypothetical protein